MKISVIFATVAVAFGSASFGQTQPANASITLEELNRRRVVGMLGLPLGTAVEIDAEVVAGRSLRRKAFESLYLLKVTHIDRKPVSAPPVLRFSVPRQHSIKLAQNGFALYEMKHGTKAARLGLSQIAELEKGYVGKTVRLVVYEVGDFSGIPRQLPNDVPIWADTGFGFSTSLQILTERSPGRKSGKVQR